VDYDPATNAYTMINKANNEGVVASDTTSGSTPSIAAQPSATLGRWEFLLRGDL
jgi:hypothetical protein